MHGLSLQFIINWGILSLGAGQETASDKHEWPELWPHGTETVCFCPFQHFLRRYTYSDKLCNLCIQSDNTHMHGWKWTVCQVSSIIHGYHTWCSAAVVAAALTDHAALCQQTLTFRKCWRLLFRFCFMLTWLHCSCRATVMLVLSYFSACQRRCAGSIMVTEETVRADNFCFVTRCVILLKGSIKRC